MHAPNSHRPMPMRRNSCRIDVMSKRKKEESDKEQMIRSSPYHLLLFFSCLYFLSFLLLQAWVIISLALFHVVVFLCMMISIVSI